MSPSIEAIQSWIEQKQGIIWTCVVLVLIYAYWDSTSGKREAERQAEEKAGIGMQATMAGTVLAGAARACQKIGMQEIPACAANTGTLLYDIVAKEQAKLALDQKASFDSTCTKYFSAQYCFNLLNRALQIAWSNQN